jgi:hypothetical protein
MGGTPQLAREKLRTTRGAARGFACRLLSLDAICEPFQTRLQRLSPNRLARVIPGHLPVTKIEDRHLMVVRRILTVALMSGVMIGTAGHALAQSSKGKAAPAKQAPAAAGSAEPTLLGQFGSWGAYTATPGGKKVCFALAKPASSKTIPANRPRDPAYAFISTRPAEKVSNEVSIMIGYQLKPGYESTLDVGGAKFAMYTQGDGLWIKNAAEEERLVEALRKGGDVTVKGLSAKGTETIDSFSMKGLAQALDKVSQECRR